MRKTLLATTVLFALAAFPAKADILLDTNGLGGTGTNVTFNSFNQQLGLVLGTLNGQHNEIVRFRDISGNPNFEGTAGSNGNDIKLFNTSDLDITVFDGANLVQVGTTRDIFSVKGEGSLFIRVTAQETDGSFKTFNFGSLTDADFQLSTSAQQGFDLTAINGEIISDVDVFVVGGSITDFEHFRIDAVPLVAAVPELSTWAMMCLGFIGIAGMAGRKQWQGFRLA